MKILIILTSDFYDNVYFTGQTITLVLFDTLVLMGEGVECVHLFNNYFHSQNNEFSERKMDKHKRRRAKHACVGA